MNYKKKQYVAMSAMCKDRIEYILEWIDYHYMIGVQHFILYDNNTYDLKNYLQQYIDNNIVTIIKWTDNKTGRQIRAQNEAIRAFGTFRWIGFLDIDEFVVLLNDEMDIKSYLQKYEDYDALGLHWMMFGSNGHKVRQDSVLKSYTSSFPQSKTNCHIKSFINPKAKNITQMCKGRPHSFCTDLAVNVLYEKSTGAFGACGNGGHAVLYKHMRINHYYTRSLEDFKEKIARGGGNLAERKYTMNHFNAYNDTKKGVFDNKILRNIQQYKRS